MGASAQTPAGVSLARHLHGVSVTEARLDLWEFLLKRKCWALNPLETPD